MKYAKLENGQLIPAPGEVRQGGMVIMNPEPEFLGPMGYKPVEYAERPEITTPGNELREVYADNGDRITVTWEECTPEPAPEIPEPIPDTTIRQVAMFATMAVNAMPLSDEQSLQIKELYPEWASFIGKSLEAGFKVLYEGRLYKVRQQIATVLENQPDPVQREHGVVRGQILLAERRDLQVHPLHGAGGVSRFERAGGDLC